MCISDANVIRECRINFNRAEDYRCSLTPYSINLTVLGFGPECSDTDHFQSCPRMLVTCRPGQSINCYQENVCWILPGSLPPSNSCVSCVLTIRQNGRTLIKITYCRVVITYYFVHTGKKQYCFVNFLCESLSFTAVQAL